MSIDYKIPTMSHRLTDTSNNTKYCLKLTPVPSVTTVLENDIPTTLVWEYDDLFGHTHYQKIPDFTIKAKAE